MTCGDSVLFQNAEGNINMGIWFNDPDIEADDCRWFNVLADIMHRSLMQNEGLVSVDTDLKTRSCYVELQRNDTK